MRVLHVIPSFQPAIRYGGPVFSTAGLCQGLLELGVDTSVLTTDADGPFRLEKVRTGEWTEWEGIPVYYCRRDWPESVSTELLLKLRHAIRDADVVHLTGVYNFPVFPVLYLCRREGKPLVWSSRGAMQRWKGSRKLAGKSVWNRTAERLSPSWLRMHATDVMEATDSAKWFHAGTWEVVPNGVAVPATLERRTEADELRLLSIGRLDPIKGLPVLIQALSLLQAAGIPLVRLAIAGAGDPSYTESLQELTRKLGVAKLITFVGEVRGEQKERLFANADLAVFPSHNENFGMVVAEALSRSLPVIVTDRMPWAGVKDADCGLVAKAEPESIAAAIGDLAKRDLRAMGVRGRRWMTDEFSWKDRARQMIAVYERAISATPNGRSKWK